MTHITNRLTCDAILFDLDGVLIDSSRCITRHWQEWATQHGLDILKIMHIAHGMRTIETIRAVAPYLDAEEETRRFTAHEIADTEGVVAIAGAAEALATLPPQAWALVTSGSRELVMARLARAGLPVPGVLVSGDDVSQGKPSPEPYLAGARQLGMSAAQCIVIEDAPAGVESGKKASMRVVGIAATHPREELLEKGADVVVDALTNLRIHVTNAGHSLAVEMV